MSDVPLRENGVTRFDGQVAVVTGGSRGIGRAIAAALAARGADVVIAARNAAVAEAAADAHAGASAFGGCDVGRSDDVDGLFRHVAERFGRLDIVVSNAGIAQVDRGSRSPPRPLMSLSDDDFDAVVRTNLRGAFLVARAAARQMQSAGQGQVVNVSSARGALRGEPFGAPYCASKMATLRMFESLAEEMAPYGVRVTSVLPDAVATELIAGTSLGQAGTLLPEQVAEFVVEILSAPDDMALDAPRFTRHHLTPSDVEWSFPIEKTS